MLLPALLLAAQVTTVADAADERHSVEFDVEATLLHQRRETRISREVMSSSGIALSDELHHLSTTDELSLRMTMGLYHDLELHVLTPFVLREQQDVRFSDTGTRTLITNRIDISGCARPGACTTVAPIVAVPAQSRRQGFRDPTIGLAWAPINEERELELRPEQFPEGGGPATWALGIDYTLPLPFAVDDPSRLGAATSLDAGGPPSANQPSRKAHVLTVWTALSRRYHALEPYVRLSGTLAFAAKGAYDNCSHPERLADVAAANCAGAWAGQTGYKPPPEAAFLAGTELVAYASPSSDTRVAFDVHGDVRYHGPGRDYTQVTDLLGKLTWADEYATAGGGVGASARLGSHFRMSVSGTAAIDTAHLLTHEAPGAEKDNVPGIQLSGGTGAPAPDQNPNYDFRLDQVGHRLRAENAFVWGVSGSLTLIF